MFTDAHNGHPYEKRKLATVNFGAGLVLEIQPVMAIRQTGAVLSLLPPLAILQTAPDVGNRLPPLTLPGI